MQFHRGEEVRVIARFFSCLKFAPISDYSEQYSCDGRSNFFEYGYAALGGDKQDAEW